MSYVYKDGLESERLITRKLTMDDVPAWLEFFTSDETTEFLKAHVLATPEESAEKWIERQLNRYQNQEYGHQALLHKTTGELIGISGLIKQDINGEIEMEVGYHVLRKHWGKGYAPEAARLFFDYGFKHLPNDSIVSLIDINNTKSQRVADKNGLQREKQIRWKDMDIFVYRMHKADWK
jgi:ribosomal-protein-alanine N-acetyltransferase